MNQISRVYSVYEDEKRKKMLLDFNDLLIEVCKLLNGNSSTKLKYQQMYRHILVDEFQDSNPAQMEILNILVGSDNGDGRDKSFWICGDDWQSIYAFTGATVGNILSFPNLYKGCRQFVLDLNYRSTPQILSACQNLISHNTRKIEKTLRTTNGNGEDVIILEGSCEEDEATLIVQEIVDLCERRGFSVSDLAVLYRANSQSRVIEEALSLHRIPYHIENGMTFYQRREVKILLDYMRLIAGPNTDDGDDALRSVINTPNRYLGRRFLRELEDYALSKDLHLYPALKRMEIATPYQRKNVTSLIGLLDPLIRDSTELEPAELIHLLREGLDYDKYVSEDEIPSPDDNKLNNVNQLQLAAARYRDIRSFLTFTEGFKEDTSDSKSGVHLMTIHKAKGLEFPVVLLVGMVDGILPNKQGDIEEERRIAFVGMSRAMRLLYLTWSRSYLGRATKPSPFLMEIDGEAMREAV